MAHDADYKVHKWKAVTLDNIQFSVVGLLMENKYYNLFVMNISPILMMDKMDPKSVMISSEIVRDVKEFGGKQCYNGLQLAQLGTHDYSINVLVWAFALSKPPVERNLFI
jgi:hypothetical protein